MQLVCLLKVVMLTVVFVSAVSGTLAQDTNPQPLVTFDQFQQALVAAGYPNVPNLDVKYNNFVGRSNNASISTRRELAMALAQFVWESDGLTAVREYACTPQTNPDYDAQSCAYGGDVADNLLYYGRGYIQLSYRENYLAASMFLFNDDRLVNNPDLVATDDSLSWAVSFFYWAKYVHASVAPPSAGFGLSTLNINGPLECKGDFKSKAVQRFVKYSAILNVFEPGMVANPDGCFDPNDSSAPTFPTLINYPTVSYSSSVQSPGGNVNDVYVPSSTSTSTPTTSNSDNTPTLSTLPSTQNPQSSSSPTCEIESSVQCVDSNTVGLCNFGHWVGFRCVEGTVCRNGNCDWPV